MHMPFIIFTGIFLLLFILWFLSQDEFLKEWTVVFGGLMVFTGLVNWLIISRSAVAVCN